MARGIPSILPRLACLLAALGENIKKARLRRAYSSEMVAQRAGITRKTLYRVERGDPAVSLGIYARVLQTLRLENDLGSVASDDTLGRKLQDANLGAASTSAQTLGARCHSTRRLRKAAMNARQSDTVAVYADPAYFGEPVLMAHSWHSDSTALLKA